MQAIAVIIALIVVATNLLFDLFHSVVDPEDPARAMTDVPLVELEFAPPSVGVASGGIRRLSREIWHSGTALAGLFVLLVIAVLAIFAPLIAPHDPSADRPAAPTCEAGVDGRLLGAPTRYGWARPRRIVAARIRRARQHDDGRDRHPARRRPRQPARDRRRLLRRLARGGDHAPRRSQHRVPRAAACADGARDGGTGADDADPDPQRDQLDDLRAGQPVDRVRACAKPRSCGRQRRSAARECASCSGTCCRTSRPRF